jgi:hypothetical protein
MAIGIRREICARNTYHIIIIHTYPSSRWFPITSEISNYEVNNTCSTYSTDAHIMFNYYLLFTPHAYLHTYNLFLPENVEAQ